jgi:hypothetical protein
VGHGVIDDRVVVDQLGSPSQKNPVQHALGALLGEQGAEVVSHQRSIQSHRVSPESAVALLPGGEVRDVVGAIALALKEHQVEVGFGVGHHLADAIGETDSIADRHVVLNHHGSAVLLGDHQDPRLRER